LGGGTNEKAEGTSPGLFGLLRAAVRSVARQTLRVPEAFETPEANEERAPRNFQFETLPNPEQHGMASFLVGRRCVGALVGEINLAGIYPERKWFMYSCLRRAGVNDLLHSANTAANFLERSTFRGGARRRTSEGEPLGLFASHLRQLRPLRRTT
jgi:hypothetical protein